MNLSAQVQDFPQMHFEFKDWQAAFDKWYQNHADYGEHIQFVVSYGTYNSGYWIEKRGTELGNSARVYTHKQVIALKSRIKREIKKAEIEGRHPKFVL